MAGHEIIVIGASAGGVEALLALVRSLPNNLSASLFVVLHLPPHTPSMLPAILDRAGPLKAHHPLDGEPIHHGHIYVALPDHHLLIERNRVRVVHGPKENRYRPAIDPLFRSAAVAYGTQVVGVVLTGSLDDGTAGLLAIKQMRGVAVVQDPKEAHYPSMPSSALAHVAVDYVLPLAEIGPLLVHLAHQPVTTEGAIVPKEMEMENRVVGMDLSALNRDDRPGQPSVFSCPECGGVLWEMQEGDLLRFRCRVGHAFSVESMMSQQEEAMEEALWTALKTLEESASLSHRLARQAHERGHTHLAARYEERVIEAEQRAALIRRVLISPEPLPPSDTVQPFPSEDID